MSRGGRAASGGVVLVVVGLSALASTFRGRSAEDWAIALAGADEAKKREAVDCLVAGGRDAVQTLLEILSRYEPDDAEFNLAEMTFAEMGDRAVPLLSDLAHERPSDQWLVCLGLRETGSPEAIACLRSLLGVVLQPPEGVDTEDWRCEEIDRARMVFGNMARMGPTGVNELLKSCEKAPDWLVCAGLEKLEALARSDDLIQAIPVCVTLLQNSNWEIRARAAGVLAKCGISAVEGLESLQGCLHDDWWAVRVAAARAISSLGLSGRGAAPYLLDGLKWPAEITQMENRTTYLNAMLTALGSIRAQSEGAISVMREFLRSDHPASRVKAARGLLLCDRYAELALPVLIEEAQADAGSPESSWLPTDRRVPDLAIDVFAEVGPRAARAIPSLRAILNREPRDRTSDLRPNAARALGMLGKEAQAALPELEALLACPKTRLEAALAYLRLGGEKERAQSALVASLREEKTNCLRTILRESAGIDSSAIASALGSAISQPQLQSEAIEALSRMGTGAQAAAAALVSQLGTPFLKLRARVIKALTSIGAPAIPALADGLRYGDSWLRLGVVLALGSLRKGGVIQVEELLRTAASDPDERVRDTAKRSME